MKGKTYGVIGLGKFGAVAADELLTNGHTVIVADKKEDALKSLHNTPSYAYILDSTSTVALKEAGFHDVDIVIISIGDNIEKSILTLMALKEIGVTNIIAKATSNIHGQILSRLGATRVIYPERESAKRLVKEFLTQDIDFEIFELSANTIRAIRLNIDDKLAGNSLKHIAQNMRLIAYKKANSDWELLPDLETTLVYAGDVVVLLGTIKELKDFEH
ncbi:MULTISPECIES: potassium channel family protein [unclassified Campylobacter]|uniref:potassium channel family protein n=1 Tax=unclassified Campylobacter TaxID=2593542 RepID=UPI001238226A|nr:MULTISPECIES: TrkA family potassium uptake protein [unclassified Campylobacter]KAA6225141.1 TrkA family potassium uptake protein [Campylobacter sp. LR196d]KAA6226155.1 TrkA family potassium uptake protein [Campylobacter sp. LR185c]KAA6228103.1 TrkA family potassium uptake protein [Campylobacter sp. LR286c]KAA6231355.1 TrkA family potassium uptake protein [Campylobacter sp. LR264d]KAA6231567.1 TrkA family potassium uptake protein [Campylobacter sp. LR291e]